MSVCTKKKEMKCGKLTTLSANFYRNKIYIAPKAVLLPRKMAETLTLDVWAQLSVL